MTESESLIRDTTGQVNTLDLCAETGLCFHRSSAHEALADTGSYSSWVATVAPRVIRAYTESPAGQVHVVKRHPTTLRLSLPVSPSTVVPIPGGRMRSKRTPTLRHMIRCG